MTEALVGLATIAVTILIAAIPWAFKVGATLGKIEHTLEIVLSRQDDHELRLRHGERERYCADDDDK